MKKIAILFIALGCTSFLGAVRTAEKPEECLKYVKPNEIERFKELQKTGAYNRELIRSFARTSEEAEKLARCAYGEAKLQHGTHK